MEINEWGEHAAVFGLSAKVLEEVNPSSFED
jgi:hypothetical protein